MELFIFFFQMVQWFQKRISLVPLSSIVSENKIEIYYVISAYSCLNCELQCCSWRGALYTILCFLSGQISDEWKQKNTTKWSPSRGEATHLIRPVFHCRRDGFIRGGATIFQFPLYKTDCHYIIKMLLEVAFTLNLNPNNQCMILIVSFSFSVNLVNINYSVP